MLVEFSLSVASTITCKKKDLIKHLTKKYSWFFSFFSEDITG